MESPRKAPGPDRQQGKGSSPGDEQSLDVPGILLTLEDRLQQLERTSQAVERRLQAIEWRLSSASPASASPLPAPVEATQPDVFAPASAPALPPKPVAAASQLETIPSALSPLLNERPGWSEPEPLQVPLGERQQVGHRPPRPVARKRQTLDLNNLERAISGRGLAWAGGLTLLLGALFFLSLAISRGWIGIEARIIIGLGAGLAITAMGDRLIRNDARAASVVGAGGDRVLGPVLAAVGVAIWDLSLVAGTRLYDIIPLWAALVGTAAASGVTIAISLRTRSQSIAVYSIVTALAAPLLFGVPAAELPMAYLAIVLAGSTAVAYLRGWNWLPPVAFGLTTLQLFAWWPAHASGRGPADAASASLAEMILVILAFTICHAIGALGMALTESGPVRRGATAQASEATDAKRAVLIGFRVASPGAVALLFLNAVSFFYAGNGVIRADLGFGVYLLLGVCGFTALGLLSTRLLRATSAFMYSAYVIATLLLTSAVPYIFSGPPVAIAWAVVAVGYVWLATHFRAVAAFAGALLPFVLSVAHLFLIDLDYAHRLAVKSRETGIHFLNEGGFTLLIILALMALAGWIVRERTLRLALTLIGAGILVMATPVLVSGSLVTVAWAAEAVALVWIATRYRAPVAFQAAALPFVLALIHFFRIVLAPDRPWEGPRHDSDIPFFNEGGLTLLVMLALLALAGRIVRLPAAQAIFASIGVGILIASMPRELTGIALLAAWAVLAVVAVVADRWLPVPEASEASLFGSLAPRLTKVAEHGLKLMAAVSGALAIYRAVIFEMPVLTDAPFENRELYVGQPLLASAIIIVAAITAAVLTKSGLVRQVAAAVAILIAAHCAADLLALAPAVAVWALLAVIAFALRPFLRDQHYVLLLTAAVLLSIGSEVTLVRIAPPARLYLTEQIGQQHPFLWSESTLALGALALALLLIARALRGTSVSHWLAVIGGAFGVYLLSVGIVDAFQAQVTQDSIVSELRRQSQMALSVTWALLGGGAILAGLARHHATARWFGLGLFAIAMLKVFLYDLSSLDAIYRVLSFIALGVLLLLSAYAYRWFERKGEAGAAPVVGEPIGGTDEA